MPCEYLVVLIEHCRQGTAYRVNCPANDASRVLVLSILRAGGLSGVRPADESRGTPAGTKCELMTSGRILEGPAVETFVSLSRPRRLFLSNAALTDRAIARAVMAGRKTR